MSDKKIQCPTCMETIDVEFNVCPFCGEDLRNVARPEVKTTPVAPPPVPAAPVPPAAPVVPPAPQAAGYVPADEYYYEEEPAGFYKTFIGREYFGRYASFGGNTARANYWFTVLALFILQLGLYGIAGLLIGLSPVVGLMVAYILFSLVGLGLLLPSLAIVVRRLRDTGASPWRILWGLVPIVGPIILLVNLCSSGETVRSRFSFKAPDWVITILCVILLIAGSVFAASSVSNAVNGLNSYDIPEVEDSTDYYDESEDYVLADEASAVEEVIVAEETSSDNVSGTYTLTGTVAGTKVIVEMMINGGTVNGHLRYAKINPPSWLDISGFFSDGYVFAFQEFNDEGMMTGDYLCEGSFDSRGRLKAISGTMTNYKGKTYSVNLTVQ